MKPPSGPKQEGLAKPELTVSPPVSPPGHSVRRSRQSQVSPLQASPHLPPGSRKGGVPGDAERPPTKSKAPAAELAEGPKKVRQPLLLSAGSKGSPPKGPEPLRRAIAECTSGAGSRGVAADRVLQEYLSQAATCDLAYDLLLEHARTEVARSPGVVLATIRLLKRILFRYLPSAGTLEAIDAFCAQLMAELNEAAAARHTLSGLGPLLGPRSEVAVSPLGGFCKDSAAVVRSLAFLRAFVARQVGPISSTQRLPRGGEVAGESRGKGRAKVSEAARHEAVPVGPEHKKVGAQEARDFLEEDVFSWRWILRPSAKGGKKQPAWAPSPVLLGSGGLSRPIPRPVRTLTDSGAAALLLQSTPLPQSVSSEVRAGPKAQLASDVPALNQASPLDPDTRRQTSAALPAADAALLQSHIRTIAAAKRRPEMGPRSSVELLKGTPAKRRTRPLFHYRPYAEQQALRLSDAEMADVLAAVCADSAPQGKGPAPPDPGVGSPADVAGSVLIKLLLDLYCAGPSLAGPLTLRLLLEMLAAAAPAVRCRAFDLVLNLGVHAHLIDPAAMHPDDAPPPPHDASSPARPGQANGAGGRAAVAQFEEWAVALVREMLLALVQAGEREEAVWVAGLSCLLYYAADQGHICRPKVDGLDVRIPAALLAMSRRHCWADGVHTALVRLAVNLLYDGGKGTGGKRSEGGLNGVTAEGRRAPTLDVKRLEALGGVAWVCHEYAEGRSREVRRNMFAVLFDLAVLRYSQQCADERRAPPGEEEVCAVAAALGLADAPEAVVLGFKLGLPGTADAVRQAIMAAMQRDVTSGRLNSELLAAVTSTLDDLALSSARPSAAFAPQLAITAASDPLLAPSGSARSSPSRSSLGASVASEAAGQPLAPPWRRLSQGSAPSSDPEALATAWATLRALLLSPRESDRIHGRCWLTELLSGGAGTREAAGLRPLKGSPAERLSATLRASLERRQRQHRPSSSGDPGGQASPGPESGAEEEAWAGVQLLGELLQCPEREVQAVFFEVVDRALLAAETDGAAANPEQAAEGAVALLSAACQLVVEANSADTPTVLRMCHLLFRQLCARRPLPLPRDSPLEGPLPALLLAGRLLASPRLLARLPVALLQWPLLRLPATPVEGIALTAAVGSRGGSGPGSSLSDVRAAMLLLLISRCEESVAAFQAVGGAFFEAVLDDPDPRLALYVSTFLLRRMARQQPDGYRTALQRLVFHAQQSNNEKLLENPYLQIRGLLREQAQAEAEGVPTERFDTETDAEA
ncbi:hypothetical protein KFL_006330070 [Klebsormidium nitens]|uniref:Uncharacterized protein n=1 Tax=Klebsormidium nitens TaxID=105231 RepID=A0A1Y1IHM5_KLENI|nr:hypothetical protein KFL_006330070 [Klebsormidium nitens]|eukprot:GAQ90380.1 hypothetical protein KFL_006330070 [Klebsormidium nitens]